MQWGDITRQSPSDTNVQFFIQDFFLNGHMLCLLVSVGTASVVDEVGVVAVGINIVVPRPPVPIGIPGVRIGVWVGNVGCLLLAPLSLAFCTVHHVTMLAVV